METIYFAHPVNTYGTAVETFCLELIRKKFPGQKIFNPNGLKHQMEYGRKGMDYFFEEVKQCENVVFLPFSDGSIGAGVYKEVECGFNNKSDIYIFQEDFNLLKIETLPTKLLTIEQTRKRIKEEENYLNFYL
ncbi:MAG: hypothetical protein WAV23_02375 [Minisyncoccia bacterium]